MVTRVLVDANVLYSRTLRDWLFLLKLQSHGGMFTVHATEDVIAETLYRLRRNNPKADGHLTTRVHDLIVECLDSRVEDYKIDGSFMGNDENDAHVHAAAVACGADILLSADSGFSAIDEKTADAVPYEVYGPDSFFVLIDDSAPHVVCGVIREQLTYWYTRRGDVNLPDQLRLADCPTFADRVRIHLQTIDWSPPSDK